jgi:stage III sporulation protein AA
MQNKKNTGNRVAKTTRLFFCKLFYSDKPYHIIIQMLEFLPFEIKEALRQVNLSQVYEIRLRADKPTTINYGGTYRYLTAYGVKDAPKNALRVSSDEIADVVFSAGDFSVYSVEEQIRKGFVTGKNGERIGLAGRYVSENGKTLTVRDFTSLCIRIPHEIVGSAEEIYKICCAGGLCNLLISSPPGIGKTTILRDLCRLICEQTQKNVLICDERGELGVGNTGESCDVLSFAEKAVAFEAGLRAMRPDVIVTDEIVEKDLIHLERTTASGVKVMASAHIGRVEELPNEFCKIFNRFVFLDGEKIGKIKAVYDKNLKELPYG